jgi:hypothetical protein
MALLTITINDPTMPSKAAEVAYIQRCLGTVLTELGRGNGNITAGTIVSYSNAGVPNSTLGAWTYVSSALRP